MGATAMVSGPKRRQTPRCNLRRLQRIGRGEQNAILEAAVAELLPAGGGTITSKPALVQADQVAGMFVLTTPDVPGRQRAGDGHLATSWRPARHPKQEV